MAVEVPEARVRRLEPYHNPPTRLEGISGIRRGVRTTPKSGEVAGKIGDRVHLQGVDQVELLLVQVRVVFPLAVTQHPEEVAMHVPGMLLAVAASLRAILKDQLNNVVVANFKRRRGGAVEAFAEQAVVGSQQGRRGGLLQCEAVDRPSVVPARVIPYSTTVWEARELLCDVEDDFSRGVRQRTGRQERPDLSGLLEQGLRAIVWAQVRYCGASFVLQEDRVAQAGGAAVVALRNTVCEKVARYLCVVRIPGTRSAR